MTSEIRTNSLKSRAGLSTVTMTDSGPMFSGITTFVDNSGFTFGVGGGTSIFTPATNVLTFGTNNTEKIRIDASGHMHGVGVITATHFYGDGSNLTGLTVPGGATNLDLLDSSGTGNGRIRLGASQDLQIYHDGSHSWFKNTTGRLLLQTDGDQIQLRGNTIVAFNGAASTEYLRINSSGKVQIAGSGAVEVVNIKAMTDGNLIVRAIGSIASAPSGSGVGLDVLNDANNAVKDLALRGSTVIFRGASAETLRIDSSGRVGINRTPALASSKLEVGGADNYPLINVEASGATAGMGIGSGALKLYYGTSEKLLISNSAVTVEGTTDGVLNLDTTDSRGSFIRFQESGTSKCFVGCGQGLSLGSATDLGLRATNHIRMRSGAEEHAVLTDEGFFAAKGMAGNWVDNTHPTSSQHHQFSNTGVNKWIMVMNQQHHAGLGLAITTNSTSNSEAIWVYSNSNNTTRFRVLNDGSVGSANNSYGGISDIKLKENIVDANSQWNDIKAIRVRNFNFKDTPDTKMLGVVAQEIETISPNLVSELVDRDPETNETLETTTKEVKYSILYMKAIKALQEAMTRIETLEQDNIALRARVTNLEGN